MKKNPLLLLLLIAAIWLPELNGKEVIRLYFRDCWKPELFRKADPAIGLRRLPLNEFSDPQGLEIEFMPTAANTRQSIFLDFPQFPADLDKFETLEFDIRYLTAPNRCKITLCAKGETGVFSLSPFTKRNPSHHVVDLGKPRGSRKFTPSDLNMLYLMQYTPAPGMRLQLANLCWADHTPVRLAEFAALLKKLRLPETAAAERWCGEYSHALPLKRIRQIREEMQRMIFKVRDELKIKLAEAPPEARAGLLQIDRCFVRLLNPRAVFPDPLEKDLEKLTEAARFQQERNSAKMHLGITGEIACMNDFPVSFRGYSFTEVHLSAARGEYEPCQILVASGREALREVRIAAENMRGPASLPLDNIRFYPMGWRLADDGRYYAEMLRSDMECFPVKPYRNQPVWMNIRIPENTVPGDYRFNVRVTAGGVPAQTLTVFLRVHPFTLPRHTSFPHIIGFNSSGDLKKREREARLIAEHRVNCSGMYESREIPLAERRRDFENGNSLFNLLRIKAPGTPAAFERLERVYKETLADPEILKRSYIYGFDEVQPAALEKMIRAFSRARKICPGVPTICAINRPLWKYREKLEFPDIPALTLNLITPEVLRLLRSQGKRIWWYNLFCLDQDPTAARAQFLATEKTGLDGALFYNLTAGSATNYGRGLYQETLRNADGAFRHYGLLRRNHRGVLMSTLAFEMWREGIEDYEYWRLLRGLAEKLPQDDPLRKGAARLLRIPDPVAPNLIQAAAANELDNCLYDALAGKASYSAILNYRAEIAALICRIQERLLPEKRQ